MTPVSDGGAGAMGFPRATLVGAGTPSHTVGRVIPCRVASPQSPTPFCSPIWVRFGCRLPLVDDTLSHKRGRSVWGLGWWRDAVASTKKRVATASGHNWVVVAVAFCVPFTKVPILALPLLARLQHPGTGQPSCPVLAREMLRAV